MNRLQRGDDPAVESSGTTRSDSGAPRDWEAGRAGRHDLGRVAEILAEVAAEAGRLLAAVADRSAGRRTKGDGTSCTAADHDSEALILARLAAEFPDVPVVAEECGATCAIGDTFFLVDPLDGTSDYLGGEGEYSVNIALVRNGRPVAAAVAVPPLGRVWAADREAREAMIGEPGEPFGWRPARVRAERGGDGLVALGSRRHGDPETARCLAALPVGRHVTASSAAKFCLIASGEADIYVRCGPTMEWDTAAGDLILTRAGGSVTGPNGLPLLYGRPADGFRNGPFVALADPSRIAEVALPRVAVTPRRAPA